MKYLYKAASLLVAHLLLLYILAHLFPTTSAGLGILILFISIFISIFYIVFGHKAYKYENTKLGGSLFIAIGIIGILAFSFFTFMAVAVNGLAG
ncbi:MAG: hypothetical protein V4664_01425 [Patescibacteria group bacterium]